ncbi:hypothetical protein, conserved [Plasmodium gonderi]|uniref:Uncharacterized protein n=1 Tax=Plasmodium gonderi TaxID=77519 RepID=A0A1Y1JLL1_PLAGO|nr:hypothetical protein, conserved [Plasmodium gonderi]GAW83140.1 hypothetical protein, conserved [Plasmodium gonderi]
MKRYILNNNTCWNTKKTKVEYQYDNELRIKGRVAFPDFFNFNKISNKRVDEDIKHKKKLGRLYSLQVEENGKRRRINFLHNFNDLGSRDTLKNQISVIPSGSTECSGLTFDEPEKSANNSATLYNQSDMNDKNRINKQEEKIVKNEFSHFHHVEIGSNYKDKKNNQIKNKYYEKINNLLKEIHLSKIARWNDNTKKCMYESAPSVLKQSV